MWPFSKTKKSTVSKTPDSDPRGESGEEMVEVEETRKKEYTEHVAVAKFSDGTERDFVFDFMERCNNCIVLGDYIDVYEEHHGRGFTSFTFADFIREKKVTIPYNQLKSFETIHREGKEMEYTTTVEKPRSEVGE